ncbi:hypothetical protein C8R46DRAFT_1056788 [Mycena filopes]|nr:hypothetical protein C8R46DRAFT_1056788 [Mycena filopes]
MRDVEKGCPAANGPDSSDDRGAAKLWAVYVSEAEKYDKSLVESWKSDMEGMLIFAGLFSASLTAFLIESYKTLTPDSGEETIRLLTQISRQLSTGPNNTDTPTPMAISFTPSTASIICNGLWFISLGLSLTCALVATLLEQWARDFIHRAETRSAPLIRARIYSYLYYGMKRFNMHVVVDIIPLLLHSSLLFFFAGLVAFLIPVNLTMTIISAAILGFVAAVYLVLTLLPLRFLDCPYRTPLSGASWRLLQTSRSIWHRSDRSDSTGDKTMVEAMTHIAGEDSVGRQERDYRALVWTVKSLADNLELEPFVEALADALWDRTEVRLPYADHIRRLANHPDLQLRSRINSLYESCYDGNTSSAVSQRRRMACCKAFWAISSLSSPTANQYPPVDFSDSRAYHEWRFTAPTSDADRYTVSAAAMMKWSTFCSLRAQLVKETQVLTACWEHPEQHPSPDFTPITSLLRQLALSGFHVEENPYPSRYTAADIPQLLKSIDDFWTSAPHTILFEYIRKSAILDSPPYQWEATTNVISIDRSLPFAAFRPRLEWNIEALMHSPHPVWSIQAPAGVHWNDTAITELCLFWRPSSPIRIPPGIIMYLNHRNSHTALGHFLRRSRIVPYLWSCFPTTLSECLAMDDESQKHSSLEDLLQSLWTLTYLDDFIDLDRNVAGYEGVLGTILSPEFPQPSNSVVALMKYRILLALSRLVDAGIHLGPAFRLNSTLFPPESVIAQSRAVLSRPAARVCIEEAQICILAELLKHCGVPHDLPFNAAETLREISSVVPTGPIDSSYQMRLVDGMGHIHRSDLMDIVVDAPCLDAYGKAPSSTLRWLDDTASALLGEVLQNWELWRGSTPIRARRIQANIMSRTGSRFPQYL